MLLQLSASRDVPQPPTKIIVWYMCNHEYREEKSMFRTENCLHGARMKAIN
jgi:hypothetical protein